MFTQVALANTNPGIVVAVGFLEKFNDIILFPLITLMVAVAFLFFIYGCFEYIIHADNETARATGRQHILWGIVGMFVMLSAYGILRIAVGTFNLQKELSCANDPTQSACRDAFRIPGKEDEKLKK